MRPDEMGQAQANRVEQGKGGLPTPSRRRTTLVAVGLLGAVVGVGILLFRPFGGVGLGVGRKQDDVGQDRHDVASALPTSAEPAPSGSAVLRTMLHAIENADAVAYEVRAEYSGPDDGKLIARTRIVVARSPFRFRAHFQAEQTNGAELAVSDGKTTRTSTGGQTGETPTWAPEVSPPSLVITNRAGHAVAATWRQLIDLDFLRQAIAVGNALYTGQHDVEGELCHIVVCVLTTPGGTATEYYWVSVKTGLPRMVQRLSLARGKSVLGPRFTLSNVRLNPDLPIGTFDYRPTSADSAAVPRRKDEGQPGRPSIVGQQVPDLEVRDLEYRPHQLRDLVGKQPTVLTIWATWCAPCQRELQALETFQRRHEGKLRVIAVAVKDSRLDVLRFVKDNPRFGVTFFTDPDMQEEKSRLYDYFADGESGIPVTVFVDTEGRIKDRWPGFEAEEKLSMKLRHWLEY